jgi:hypothetical protein
MIIIFHRMEAHALLNFRKKFTSDHSVLDPSTQYKMSLSQYGTGPHGIARMTYKHGDQVILTGELQPFCNVCMFCFWVGAPGKI